MALTPCGIHYEVSAGTGPPVVFLHGVTLDSRLWSAQLAAFGDRWRCITVDLRGHGLSAPLEPGYDPTSDLLQVLDESGVDRCILVGLSLGGHDAVVFAALHPDRCRALVLVDAWIPGPELAGWEPPFRLAREVGREAARDAWLADPIFAPARRQRRLREELRSMVAANDLRIWTAAIPRAPHPSARELALQIHAPTLVVVGEEDRPGFRAAGAWLAETIPGAIARPGVTLLNAGHLPPMEAPEAFNRELSAFVDSASGEA